MTDDTTTQRTEAPTRRQFVGYGSVAVGSGLAGCMDGNTSSPDTDGEADYEVCLEPVGCQSFESPPNPVRRFCSGVCSTLTYC